MIERGGSGVQHGWTFAVNGAEVKSVSFEDLRARRLPLQPPHPPLQMRHGSLPSLRALFLCRDGRNMRLPHAMRSTGQGGAPRVVVAHWP